MNKEYDQHIVIKTLDNPTRILFWDLPDFVLLVLPFFLGMLLESSLILIGGLMGRLLMKKVLRKMPKAYLKRAAYWYLPTRIMNHLLKTDLPPSHVRRFMH